MTTGSAQSASKLWLAAMKPPMYCVAIMPIVVGSTVAYFDTQQFNWGVFLTFLCSAVLILVWENFSNDVFDSETGIDVNKPHSLVNLTQNKALVFGLGNLCLGLGIAGVVVIAWWQRDPTVLGLIALCCALGYAYQGPPFRLGYRGLGEILCFFSFGPLGVGAAYYSQAQGVSTASQMAAMIVGLTTTLVLFCSHFHQVKEDLAAGKRSPIVRLGTRCGAALVPWFCGGAVGLTLLGVGTGLFPPSALLLLLSLPPAVRLSRHVQRFHNQPEQVSNAKFFAIGFHFWSGLLLAVGFWLAA